MENPYQSQPPTPPPGPTPQSQQNLWTMLCHLTSLAVFIGIPFGNVIGPLIIWLIKKDEIPAVDEHGKESLNFQLSITIYAIVSIPLVLVVVGIFLLLALAILHLVCVIIASVKANEGELYRYPLTIRFIK